MVLVEGSELVRVKRDSEEEFSSNSPTDFLWITHDLPCITLETPPKKEMRNLNFSYGDREEGR